WRQEARHGAGRKNGGKGPLFAAVCKSSSGVGSSARKTGRLGAEALARIDRGISRQSALRRRVCESHGPANSSSDETELGSKVQPASSSKRIRGSWSFVRQFRNSSLCGRLGNLAARTNLHQNRVSILCCDGEPILKG